MAISEKHKQELVAEYNTWLGNSKAVILTGYMGLTMKDLDGLRNKIREAGGEFHVVKNTLVKLACKESGLPLPENFFEGSTAIGIAFRDAPALAKVMNEFARTSDFLKIKGGYLSKRSMTADQVKALADLPPLPVMRARLLGTLLAPASHLARTLAEPGRRIAAVVKAHSERDAAPAVG